METKTVSFFSFCNFFEFLTSRTEKVVWLKPIVFKTDFSYFSVMNNSGKFKETS